MEMVFSETNARDCEITRDELTSFLLEHLDGANAGPGHAPQADRAALDQMSDAELASYTEQALHQDYALSQALQARVADRLEWVVADKQWRVRA